MNVCVQSIYSYLFQTFCRDVDAQIVEIQTNEENNFLKNYLLHNHKNGLENTLFNGFLKKYERDKQYILNNIHLYL